jgi:hypothetical protein
METSARTPSLASGGIQRMMMRATRLSGRSEYCPTMRVSDWRRESYAIVAATTVRLSGVHRPASASQRSRRVKSSLGGGRALILVAALLALAAAAALAAAGVASAAASAADAHIITTAAATNRRREARMAAHGALSWD